MGHTIIWPLVFFGICLIPNSTPSSLSFVAVGALVATLVFQQWLYLAFLSRPVGGYFKQFPSTSEFVFDWHWLAALKRCWWLPACTLIGAGFTASAFGGGVRYVYAAIFTVLQIPALLGFACIIVRFRLSRVAARRGIEPNIVWFAFLLFVGLVFASKSGFFGLAPHLDLFRVFDLISLLAPGGWLNQAFRETAMSGFNLSAGLWATAAILFAAVFPLERRWLRNHFDLWADPTATVAESEGPAADSPSIDLAKIPPNGPSADAVVSEAEHALSRIHKSWKTNSPSAVHLRWIESIALWIISEPLCQLSCLVLSDPSPNWSQRWWRALQLAGGLIVLVFAMSWLHFEQFVPTIYLLGSAVVLMLGAPIFSGASSAFSPSCVGNRVIARFAIYPISVTQVARLILLLNGIRFVVFIPIAVALAVAYEWKFGIPRDAFATGASRWPASIAFGSAICAAAWILQPLFLLIRIMGCTTPSHRFPHAIFVAFTLLIFLTSVAVSLSALFLSGRLTGWFILAGGSVVAHLPLILYLRMFQSGYYDVVTKPRAPDEAF